MKQGFVYILTNQNRNVFYTGVTNNLIRRLDEHSSKLDPQSFTAKYRTDKLVYYEIHENICFSTDREKAIKRMSRLAKKRLIRRMNPNWTNLKETIH